MKSSLNDPLIDSTGRSGDPAAYARVVQEAGLVVLTEPDIAKAHQLAQTLIGGPMAPLSTYLAVQQLVKAAIFGIFEKNQLTGALASFPVNAEGLTQLESGDFNARDLDLSLLSPPGAAPSAYYGWGFAGATKRAAGAVVLASRALHRRLFWAIPTFARAVTPAGLRAVQAIGFRPVSDGPDGLVRIEPFSFAPGAAA